MKIIRKDFTYSTKVPFIVYADHEAMSELDWDEDERRLFPAGYDGNTYMYAVRRHYEPGYYIKQATGAWDKNVVIAGPFPTRAAVMAAIKVMR